MPKLSPVSKVVAGPEEALAKLRERLDVVVEGMGLGTWEWNVKTGECAFNDRWARIAGYSLDELQPADITTWTGLTHTDDLAESERLLELHLIGITERFECESRVHHANGSWRWVLDSGKIVEWDEDGDPLRMFGTRADITETVDLRQQVRELQIRDPLTDVYNRGYVLARLDETVAECKRRGRPFCVSLLDIDHFRAVNDGFGHPAGDFVLTEFAGAIQAMIRQYDVLGRYGGEEFVIVSTSATPAEIGAMVGRVMERVHEKTFVFGDDEIRFTFSCGLAGSSDFTPDTLTTDAIVALATKRLQAAKSSGKGTCVGPDA